MKNLKTFFLASILFCFAVSCNQKSNETNQTQVKDTVSTSAAVTVNSSDDAVQELKNGNKRFLENKLINTNYKEQIALTKGGQKPHSVILSCMDSRVPPEIIFDQGIGNIFAVRVAGNIEDENMLGSMEYATEHAGAKLIVVMGHSHCGAVTGAVKNIHLGNLTQLVDQIKPAITSDSTNANIIDETAQNNVKNTIKDILNRSEIISEMVNEKKLKIIGAFYDIETGSVSFIE
ncbi:MAG: carbonic anhydrase [Bacteroidetes bacterium]|nr:carbonic anhydrase [Bacteroidota bacterium]